MFPAFAFSAVFSLTSAAATPKSARGSNTGAIRCTCAISEALAEPAAIQKCQFSGFSRASRLSFQRMNSSQLQYFRHKTTLHCKLKGI
jgi:hypothetical protein